MQITVDVGGARLTGRTLGPPDAPIAVVVHGVGSTADFALRCLAPALLSLGYRVLGYDLRGHGASDASADVSDHTVETHVGDLDRMAQDYPPALVAGVSLGGLVAIGWAATHAPGVDLWATLAGFPDPGSVQAAFNRVVAEDIAASGVAAVLARMRADRGTPRWVVDEVTRAWAVSDPACLVAAHAAVATATMPAGLERLTGRIAVAALADDPAHPLAGGRSLAAALPRARLGVTSLLAVGNDRAVLGRTAARVF